MFDVTLPRGVKMQQGVIRRRDLMRLSAAAGAATLLAACLPESPAPSATPAAAPPAAPAATPTTSQAAKPVATATISQAANAAPTSAPAPGAQYATGKLEGPTIVTDPSKFPKTLKEAPELAALVQQGKLPPVAERIGQDPLVIQPVHEIGKYGGTMHKVFFGGINDMSIARFMT